MKLWHYLENSFLNVTRNNFALFLKISLFHLNALLSKAGDAFFDPMIASYTALHNGFEAAYNQWTASQGTHITGTNVFEDLLAELRSNRIDNWIARVKVIYGKNTPQFKGLFKDGTKPFQTGKRDDIVAAVNTLNTQLAADPALAAIQVDVDTFYKSLVKARSDQQMDLSETHDYSSDVDQARIAACIGMYSDLGLLMSHYADNPVDVEPYFALTLIRNAEQVFFRSHVKPLQTHLVFERSLQPNDSLRITVDTAQPLAFAFVNEKNDTIGDKRVTVPGLESRTIKASDFGNVPDFRFFKVYNADDSVTGHFTVEILIEGKGVIN